MEKHVAKWKPTIFIYALKFGFTSSLLFFLISKFLRIAKNWVEDAITVSVKKKTRPEFWKYEKSSLYKIFLYKFCTKWTQPIFDLVKV